MPPVLEIESLNVWLRSGRSAASHIVRDLSLVVQEGERVGLVGESGCGKSTALFAVMGLLPPGSIVSGSVRIRGREALVDEWTLARHRWSDVAMVFQNALSALNPTHRVGRQVVEPYLNRKLGTKAEAASKCRDLLRQVGLDPSVARCFPHELSGGMTQRVCIAMALMCDPAVILADEPTTAVDSVVQAEIAKMLDELCEERGLSMVLVTHDLAFMNRLCDTAFVMYAGRIIERGPAEGLFGSGLHPYTRALFAATPRLGMELADITTLRGSPPRLDVELVGCEFAPRCPRQSELCLRERPSFSEHVNGRGAACHHATAVCQEQR